MVAVQLRQPKVDKLSGDFGALVKAWLRSLRAERKSEATVRAYTYAVIALGDFLEREGMPTDPANITSEHVREFLIDQAERNSAATARLRRTYLSVFWGWLIA